MRPDRFEPSRHQYNHAPRKTAGRVADEMEAGDDEWQTRARGVPQRREHVRDHEALRQIREFKTRY